MMSGICLCVPVRQYNGSSNRWEGNIYPRTDRKPAMWFRAIVRVPLAPCHHWPCGTANYSGLRPAQSRAIWQPLVRYRQRGYILHTGSYGNLGDGGAVFWAGIDGDVENCRFIGNKAIYHDGYKIVIFLTSSFLLILLSL